MDKNLRAATEQELESHVSKSNIRLYTVDRNSRVLTIWFWRTKSSHNTYHSKSINISWMRKVWRNNKVKPQWGYRDNGGKKSNGDTCYDGTFGLGYLQLNYINWNLQGN